MKHKLCVVALMITSIVGISAKPEQAMPILSLHASRIGPVDVQTTINILPSPLNVAVCVGLAGAHYPARWGCQFVTDKDTTSVTIAWRDVPYEDYAIEAGLMQAHRIGVGDRKSVQTFRRVFGVVKL